MDKEITKEILQRIDIYAEKLGILSTDIFNILIKQQGIQAFIDILVIISLSIVCLIAFKRGKKAYDIGLTNSKEVERKEWEDLDIVKTVIPVGLGVLSLVGVIVTLSTSFQLILGRILNPSYYAILEMRQLF